MYVPGFSRSNSSVGRDCGERSDARYLVQFGQVLHAFMGVSPLAQAFVVVVLLLYPISTAIV